MPVKTFADGSFLEYERGEFDNWCVYLTDASGTRTRPRDIDYFAQLKELAGQFDVETVYNDFVKIYNFTERQTSNEGLDSITMMSMKYGESALQADIVFTTLYLAMIAEENKENTKLGKRIKRLGVHKLLIEDMPVLEAANFMRKMHWQDIALLCDERGF